MNRRSLPSAAVIFTVGSAALPLSRELDPTRLVDTDSGGGANNLAIGDVNDVHSYPYPGDPQVRQHLKERQATFL